MPKPPNGYTNSLGLPVPPFAPDLQDWQCDCGHARGRNWEHCYVCALYRGYDPEPETAP